MKFWLLEQAVFSDFQAQIAKGVLPTAEQFKEFSALYGAEEDFPGSRIMTKAGDQAEINIQGILTKKPSWMAMYFGGGNTAYSELIAAVNEAERDPNIKQVTFSIDSPGGMTSGLTKAMDAIRGMTKPTKAFVTGQACSAAYGLASQTGTIVAEDRGIMVGSIGVLTSYFVYPEEVTITSTNAPKKAPDATTEEGKADIRATLDQIETIFIDDIAKGRGISAEVVKKDYGQGGVFLAENALTRGMIDKIETEARSVTPAGVTSQQEASSTMDLAELKAKHPETYKAAVADGEKQERDRVSAHLIMGEASGDMTTAIKAVKDGDHMTATHQASYMAAGMKKSALGARAADDIPAGAAATDTTIDTNAADDFDAALSRLVPGYKGA